MPSSISVLSEMNPLEDFTPKVGLLRKSDLNAFKALKMLTMKKIMRTLGIIKMLWMILMTKMFRTVRMLMMLRIKSMLRMNMNLNILRAVDFEDGENAPVVGDTVQDLLPDGHPAHAL